jgi:hypothetical protein
MNADTSVTTQEIEVEPAGPFVAPIEPDLKSERLQEDTTEPTTQAG